MFGRALHAVLEFFGPFEADMDGVKEFCEKCTAIYTAGQPHVCPVIRIEAVCAECVDLVEVDRYGTCQRCFDPGRSTKPMKLYVIERETN